MNKEYENIFLLAIQENKDRLFRICHSYSNSSDEAKDIYQEVLLNIWKSIVSFKNQANLDTWMYRIAINVCLRAKYNLKKSKSIFVPLESIQLEKMGEVPSLSCDTNFLILYQCIKKLEEPDKSIILLHLENFPYKKIASIFNISENHVAVKIKRIKSKLLHCLKSNNYERG
jgi:RNA polymerase sigma factor (sigma-70 family)